MVTYGGIYDKVRYLNKIYKHCNRIFSGVAVENPKKKSTEPLAAMLMAVVSAFLKKIQTYFHEVRQVALSAYPKYKEFCSIKKAINNNSAKTHLGSAKENIASLLRAYKKTLLL